MTLHEWLGLATCVGELGLAVLCVARGARGPLALPLAVLCFVMFGWTFAEWAGAVSGARAWGILDVALSPLTLPAALYFVVAFVGARRRLRWLLVFVAVPSVLLSLASASAFASGWGLGFSRSPLRGNLQGALIVPTVAAGVWLLIRHDRAQSSVEEKIRTRLVVAALIVGGALAATDVLGATLPVPSMLVTTGLLALVALRFQVFDREPSRLTVVYAFTVAMLGVLGVVLVLRLFATNVAVAIFALATVTLAFGVALRQVVLAIGAQRAQMERLAVLGRLSGQMAHDLRNPLTALKGAVQFLQTERTEGRSMDAQGEFIDLIGREVDRLARLVQRYQQLGRLEPVRRALDVNAIVQRVAGLRRMSLPEGTHIDLDLATNLPPCEADADLLTTAIENLVANAVEALGERGRVLLRTSLTDEDAPGIVISVEDDGTGMDARQLERAFDEFFTTKTTGSGLGLPFVKRVAEAHGGRVEIESAKGVGTRVRISLPVSRA